MKKVISLVLALVMMLGLCAAASAAVTQDDLLGVWDMDMQSLLAMMGMEGEDAEMMEAFMAMMSCTMEFTAQGTYTMKMVAMGQEELQEGTYALADGKIIMDGGAPSEITLADGVLTIAEDGVSLSFVRSAGQEESAGVGSQLSALMALLGNLETGETEGEDASEPAAGGKLEIVEENALFIQSYSNLQYVYAVVKNYGTADAYVQDCLLKVFDAQGNEIAVKEYGDTNAAYLKPGESTVISMNADVEEATPASYTLTITQGEDAYYANTRYDAQTKLALNVEDGWSVRNYLYASVTNNTDDTVYDLEAAFALRDEDGSIIYVDDKTCYDLGIPSGGSVIVRLDIPDEFMEYYEANGIKPAAVDVIAFTEEELY